MDVHVSFGEVKQWVLRTFVQYLIAFCGRPEEGSDVVSGRLVWPAVPDTLAKLCGPRANHSRDILPEGVGGGIFHGFSR